MFRAPRIVLSAFAPWLVAAQQREDGTLCVRKRYESFPVSLVKPDLTVMFRPVRARQLADNQPQHG